MENEFIVTPGTHLDSNEFIIFETAEEKRDSDDGRILSSLEYELNIKANFIN